MHLGAIKSMQIPLRGATQPLGHRWGFETISNDVWAYFRGGYRGFF
jgi:hypothetical protein